MNDELEDWLRGLAAALAVIAVSLLLWTAFVWVVFGWAL